MNGGKPWRATVIANTHHCSASEEFRVTKARARPPFLLSEAREKRMVTPLSVHFKHKDYYQGGFT